MSCIRNFLISIVTYPQADKAREQLNRLRLKDQLNQSTVDDLKEWEKNLKILSNSKALHESTKLLNEKLLKAFRQYLKKHYPGDKRLVNYNFDMA